MKCPDEVKLSREDGEALRQRLARNALTADDRRVLDHVLQWYFWLLFALQEARFSLKRLRALVFGDRAKKRPQKPSSGGVSASGGSAGGPGATLAEAPESQADDASTPPAPGKRRSGHGRQGAQAYSGAAHVVCHHETLAVGERCPVCGRGVCMRCRPAWRCASTATRCCRRCGMRWRSSGARPVVRCSRRPRRRRRGQKNTAPGHEQCWSWGATT